MTELTKYLFFKIGVIGGIFVFVAGVYGMVLASAGESEAPVRIEEKKMDYKVEMVTLIEELHDYAKDKNSSFEFIGNNGLALFMPTDHYPATAVERLMKSVDGIFMEEYNFGWEMKDDERTPLAIKLEIDEYLTVPRARRLPILNVDYCKNESNAVKAYQSDKKNKFIGFVADSRELNTIPKRPEKLYNENSMVINSLKDVKNFLILLNPEQFRNKIDYLSSLKNSNYDLLIVDLTFNGKPITRDEIAMLKTKKNGAKRLVYSYMSVGEAEDYRAYWQEKWQGNMPDWIATENENWAGNYKVKYWNRAWKSILYGNSAAYLDLIIDNGFDGAFLDVIDAFVYFEEPGK